MQELADPGEMNYGLNRVPVTLQFNKKSGAFITYIRFSSPDQKQYLNLQYSTYVDVEMDTDKETVVGNVENFKIVPTAEMPTAVYERHLDGQAQAKIEKSYSIQKQLDIMSNLLDRLSSIIPNGDELEEFKEMRSYIELVQSENALRKKVMMSTEEVEYITYEEENKRQEAKLAGGLSEYHGSRSEY